VERSCKIANIHGVIVNGPFLDECTLGVGDEVMCGCSQRANILVIIFATSWMRLRALPTHTL
jgi:hypothetical protein